MNLQAKPIYSSVSGSPYQPGDFVRIVDCVDKDIHDVSSYLDQLGVVKYLEYSCGSGQSYPEDPMIGVHFSSGRSEEFWPEELRLIKVSSRQSEELAG